MPTSHERASKIMGRNLFSTFAAQDFLHICPTKRELGSFDEIPFSEEVLTACRETHILVAVFPISICELDYKLTNERLIRLVGSERHERFSTEAFANDRGKAGWHLVRKTPINNSTGETWEQQRLLLGQDEETPSARVMIYMIMGHFKATGERLFEQIGVRCSDRDSDGLHVVVGPFISDGLRVVKNHSPGLRFGLLGLASEKKTEVMHVPV